jgi:hypothetical protein
MPLPSSGSISLNQIHIEAGGSSGSQASLNDADIRAMIGKSSGASNAFSEYYGVSASTPSVSYRGRVSTTGNGFPNGYVNLSSGTKVVVVCLQSAGYGNTYISLGSSSMTLAAKMDAIGTASGVWNVAYTSAVYYLTSSASGSVYVTGNGGTGRSSATIYEITGYNSATPYTTDTAQQTNADLTADITVASQYNGLTIGSVICEDSFSASGITITNADTIHQQHLESASAHTSWYDSQTPSGNRTYTITQTNPGNNVYAGSTLFQMASASWK